MNRLSRTYTFLIAFLVLIGHSFSAWCATPTPLSEKAYLLLVLEENDDLKALRTNLEAQLFSIRSEIAVQRPSLGLSSEANRWLDRDRGDRLMNLNVSQRIDLAGRYGLQERDLLLGLDILQSQYGNSLNETLARADSAYRQAVMAGLNREMMKTVLLQRRESLKVTKEKFDKELVPLLDLLRAQSQVDDGEALLLQAQQAYEQQLIDMAALAGQTEVVPIVEVPNLTGLDPTVDLEDAWQTRPDVAALILTRERASVQRTLAARGLAPYLDLSVGWRVAEDYLSPYMEDRQGELMARAVLTIPVADGKKTANATKAGTLLVEKTEQELDARHVSLKREIDLVSERWKRALKLEAVRRRQMDRAAEELEIAEMMYREGLASQLDLLNAQGSDQQARTDHLATVQELWLVLSESDRVMGRFAAGAPE